MLLNQFLVLLLPILLVANVNGKKNDTLLRDNQDQRLLGINWCGIEKKLFGKINLSISKGTDSCCNEHDKCSSIIKSGETKFGLKNDAKFSKYDCSCESKLFTCLKKVSDLTSKSVGRTYFNTIGAQCFKCDYPIAGCKKYDGLYKKRCVDYYFNSKLSKKYQWFDVLIF